MERTPPKPMKTRSVTRKQTAAKLLSGPPSFDNASDPTVQHGEPSALNTVDGTSTTTKEPTTTRENHRLPNRPRSRTSSTASHTAKRAALEYAALQEQARIREEQLHEQARIREEQLHEQTSIQQKLVQKRLEVQLAELEEENEAKEASTISERVNDWMNKSMVDHLSTVPSGGKEIPIAAPSGGRKSATAAPSGGILQPPTAPPGSNNYELQDGFKMLASALRDVVQPRGERNEDRLLSRLASRPLPKFDGNPLEWINFREAYQDSTSLCSFSPSENIMRLRDALEGEAYEAVNAMLQTKTDPANIMETLRINFGDTDILVQKYLAQLRRVTPIPENYQEVIIPFATKVQNIAAAIQSVSVDKDMEYRVITKTVTSKMPGVLKARWQDYFRRNKDQRVPNLSKLVAFLNEEVQLAVDTGMHASMTQPNEVKKKPVIHDVKPKKVNVVLVHQEEKSCPVCKEANHALPACREFEKLQLEQRWSIVRKHRLCFICISARHQRRRCRAKRCGVDGCCFSHHHLLHDSERYRKKPEQESNETSVETVTHTHAYDKVLLEVLPVTLRGPNGEMTTHALLDRGSTITLMEEEVAEKLGLDGRSGMLVLRNLSEITHHVRSKKIKVEVKIKDGPPAILSARLMKNLRLPTQNYSTSGLEQFEHLQDVLRMLPRGNVRPKLLIGQDNLDLMLPIETRRGGAGEPAATLTQLGWIVHGRIDGPCKEAAAFHTTHDESLDQLMRENFTLESAGVGVPRRNREETRAIAVMEATTRRIGRRWETGLLWKTEELQIPDSRETALKRLHSIEKKMERDKVFATAYRQEVEKLFDRGYAESAPRSGHPTWFLPHFAIKNVNKPDKLRLVFDAAAKTRGTCLNDLLMTGPDLYASLPGVLMRFRKHQVAITADIQEMFLQIKIRKVDRDAQRFLWRKSRSEPVQEFRMSSLIFGATSSPSIAQYIRDHNADEFEAKYPAAVKVIRRDHYMDDCLHSAPSEEEAAKLIEEVSWVHAQGGFNIVGWNSNSLAVLQTVPEDKLARGAVAFKSGEQQSERVLGLKWEPGEDNLLFDTSFKKIPAELLSGEKIPTKREMLRVIMSIFDPLGFLAPLAIQARILLQDTWRSGIEWDQQLQPIEAETWYSWLQQLSSITTVRVPRFYGCLQWQKENVELHVFVDAGERAYATVAYWRKRSSEKTWSSSLIGSKCRVAPLKPLSMPRMELMGAVLGARFAKHIEEEHEFWPRRVIWTDSSTVLHWIRGDPRRFQAFVAHRLGEIDELTAPAEWRWVPSRLNPADEATKVKTGWQTSEQWLTGPEFLQSDEESWPQDLYKPEPAQEAEVELRQPEVVLATKSESPMIHFEHFSKWNRLLRSTALAFVFAERCQKKRTCLNEEMMQKAEKAIIRQAQEESFSDEVRTLKSGGTLEKKSRLYKLNPIIDDDGLVRLEGRISAASGVEADAKQQWRA